MIEPGTAPAKNSPAPGQVLADTRTGPHGDSDAPYLPRLRLSRAARALTEVVIDSPPGAPSGRFSAALLLYIDETGRVHRVQPGDGPRLPDVLHDSAVAAFMAARFSPGEVDGQAVRSLYPVQVDFMPDTTLQDTGGR